MDSQLEIRDGDPPYWWESPDIYVSAPDATSPIALPSNPVAGQNYSVWAQVFNNGTTPVQTPRVNFYWAPGAAQVTFDGASFIGTGEYLPNGQDATLSPEGGHGFVQCLEGWIPPTSGHFCLIAVAYDPADDSSLQAIVNSGVFDPQNNPNVAQRNLNILAGTELHHVQVMISALRLIDKEVVIEAHVGGTLSAVSLNRLGLHHLKPGRAEPVEVSIGNEPHSGAGPLATRSLPLKVQRGGSRLVHAAIRAPHLGAGEYQLVRVIERAGGRTIGGISYIVIANSRS